MVGAKCRQTDSIGSDGVRLPIPESIRLFRMSVRERFSKFLITGERVSRHDLRTTTFMCSALVSHYRLQTNDECYMCGVRVSPHNIKNEQRMLYV